MIRINLLPLKEIKAEFGRRQQLIVAGVCLGVAVAAIIGLYLFQSYRLSNLEKELAGLRKEIETLNVQVKGVAELEKKVAEVRGKIKVIDDLNKMRTGPVRVMESLSSVTPTRLWLTQYRETGGNLHMEGLAIDHQTIADFLKALSGSAHFKNVELIETTQVEEEGVPLKRFAARANVLYQLPPPAPDKAGAGPTKAVGPEKEGTKKKG